MTQRENFLIFFPQARCRKNGRKYVVTCYNYEVSLDKITASEALTAEKAWSNAWQCFKRQVFSRMSKAYPEPWLELPNGVMIPGMENIKWTWEEFRADRSVRHLWVDILQAPPRGISTLDSLIQLASLEVCD